MSLSLLISTVLDLYFWCEKRLLHPGIRATEGSLREARMLVFILMIIGGIRIIMLLCMWLSTGDDRYLDNALQLQYLSFSALLLPFTPSYQLAAVSLLCVGHLRYAYAICLVDSPLLSELFASLCIPIVSYYLAGFRWSIASALFCSVIWIIYVWNGGELNIKNSFEPALFHTLSILWATLGAASIAVVQRLSYQQYQSRLQERLQYQEAVVQRLEENDTTLKQYLAVLSHEVRNPLSVMLGRLSLLSRTGHRRRQLARAMQQVEQVINLLNTVMSGVRRQDLSGEGIHLLEQDCRTIGATVQSVKSLLLLHSDSERIVLSSDISTLEGQMIRESIHLERQLLGLGCYLMSFVDQGSVQIIVSVLGPEIVLRASGKFNLPHNQSASKLHLESKLRRFLQTHLFDQPGVLRCFSRADSECEFRISFGSICLDTEERQSV